MSNKDINRDDDFDNILRNKLDDYQLPVDMNGWDAINDSLRHRKRYVFIRRGLSIAAAIAFLVFITINYRSDRQGIQLSQIAISDITKENHIGKGKTDPDVAPIASIYNQSRTTTKKDNKILVDAIDVVETNTKSSVDSLIDLPNSEPEINIAHNQTINNESGDSISDNKDDILLNKGYDDILYTEDIIPLLTKPKSSWTMVASLNSFGSSNETRAANHLAGVLPDNYNYKVTALSQNSITDVDYDIPISFSLMAGKRINSFLSIETGLSYTRLNTKFREKGNFSTSELELHYIGIPINAIIDVWNITPKLHLYAGGGFAIEKGIRAKYKHLYNESGQSTVTKDNVSGLQWSLNASVGISYRLVGNFNLYAEPKLYYYFDNNQPLSIRTDKQTVIGFNSGIRFEF